MRCVLVAIVVCNILHSIREVETLRIIPDTNIPNHVIFEKFEYQIFNKTLLKDVKFQWKMVAYNTITYNWTVTVTEPIDKLWIHVVLYYKYRTYQKYLVDVWVNVCAGFKNIEKFNSPVGKLLWDWYQKYRGNIIHNFKFRCPLFGNLESRLSRGFNISQITWPLMQSGRYYADYKLAHYQNGRSQMTLQVYGSISDHRVWF